MKKFISGITALTLLFVNALAPLEAMADTIFFDEDFEQYETGAEIAGFDIYSAAGTITADEISGNKALFNSIINDGIYSTVSKKFTKAENYLNIFSLSFREKNNTSNGTVIASLYSEGTPVVKIVTAGKNIEYVTKTENVVIIEDYNPNVWYDIEIHVDTANKTAAVFADGELIAERLPYLNSVYFVDEFRSYGCASPGYYLDNLKGYVQQDIYDKEIVGNSSPAIPSSGSAQYEYELVIRDPYGNNIQPDAVVYTLSPSVQGISLQTEKTQAILTVDSTATAQEITIVAKATVDSMAIDDVSKTLKIENAAPERIEISGQNKIYGSNEYSYSAKLYNASGTLSDGNVVWSIENAPANVSIDNATGLLRVEGELEDDGRFDILAQCTEAGISEKLTVATVRKETYKRDSERLEIVKTVLDNALLYGTDPYRGTPLIADGLDAYSLTPAIWRMNNNVEIAMSNLANQANLMMAFDGLTNLTGDNKYHDRVREIYKYMLKHYTDEKNGLLYWGGHSLVDLKSGNPKGHTGDAEPTNHEFKNHMVYFEPFFEIDPDRAADIIKGVWAGHIADWKTLKFNRHGYYSAATNPNTTWNNTGVYDESTVGTLITSGGEMPFRNAANDLMYCAYTLFEQTGDEKGLLWANRLLERYNALADPETKIGVYQFLEAQQKHNPWVEIGEWWNKIYPTPTEYGGTNYGDRAKNQFEQQFVDEGIIKEDERWKIREAYWVSTGSIYKDGPLNDFKLAELFGKESREGKKIIKAAVEGMASYARLAYMPETNKFRYILSSGIDLTGYVLKTGGYYGDIGSVFSAATVSPGFMISYSKAYDMCGDTEEFVDDKQEIWKVIRGVGKANDLGDLGETAPGDNANINMMTSCSDPYIIVGLINLYRTTGESVYLQLARRIGDNIVAQKFNGRFFVASSSSKYIKLTDNYAYILLMLEAETRNTPEAVTEFRLCDPFYHADILMDNGWQRNKMFDRSVYWTMTLPSVYVREIKTNSDYVELSPGETYDLGVTVIPDDASSKTVEWISTNEAVADTDGQKVYAYSEGVTVLRGVSSDMQAKKQVTIRVKK